MTCRRCGLPETKSTPAIEVTATNTKTGQGISFYLCPYCWNEINDYVFHKREMGEPK